MRQKLLELSRARLTLSHMTCLFSAASVIWSGAGQMACDLLSFYPWLLTDPGSQDVCLKHSMMRSQLWWSTAENHLPILYGLSILGV
jgi:hypothetical protein